MMDKFYNWYFSKHWTFRWFILTVIFAAFIFGAMRLLHGTMPVWFDIFFAWVVATFIGVFFIIHEELLKRCYK